MDTDPHLLWSHHHPGSRRSPESRKVSWGQWVSFQICLRMILSKARSMEQRQRKNQALQVSNWFSCCLYLHTEHVWSPEWLTAEIPISYCFLSKWAILNLYISYKYIKTFPLELHFSTLGTNCKGSCFSDTWCLPTSDTGGKIQPPENSFQPMCHVRALSPFRRCSSFGKMRSPIDYSFNKYVLFLLSWSIMLTDGPLKGLANHFYLFYLGTTPGILE